MIWARWAGVMGVPRKCEIARIFVVGTGGSGFCAEAAPSGVIGFFMAVAPYSPFGILLFIAVWAPRPRSRVPATRGGSAVRPTRIIWLHSADEYTDLVIDL